MGHREVMPPRQGVHDLLVRASVFIREPNTIPWIGFQERIVEYENAGPRREFCPCCGQTRKSVSSALTATSRITGRPMTRHEEIHGGSDPRMSTGHDGAKASHRLPIRTLVAASVGNAVEWYDWTIYATFSIYFATQIFSAENESLALIGTFATYALAFFFRPLGGSLLGRYADLKGRKQAMLLTIMLMAGGSPVIASLPTHPPARRR